jgi:hypothetical protein
MHQVLSKLFLKELDQALLACLEAFYQVREGLYAYQVESQTGYTDRRVAQTLKALERFGLIACLSRRWQITPTGLDFISGLHCLVESLSKSEAPGGQAGQPAAESQNRQSDEIPDLPNRQNDDDRQFDNDRKSDDFCLSQSDIEH